MEKCNYRNCDNNTDNKYCCTKCRHNEKKYIQRDRKKLAEDKKNIYKILNEYSAEDKKILDLYIKIYK